MNQNILLLLLLLLLVDTTYAEQLTYGDGIKTVIRDDGTKSVTYGVRTYQIHDGRWIPAEWLNQSNGNWTYNITTFPTYYHLSRNGDSLILNKTVANYRFDLNKISFSFIVTPAQLGARSIKDGVWWYIPLPDAAARTKFVWDNRLPDVYNESGVYLNSTEYEFRRVGGELRLYYNQTARDFGLNSSQITFDFNSWTVGSGGSAWSGNSSSENTTVFRGNVMISNIHSNSSYGVLNYLSPSPYGSNKSSYRVYSQKNMTVDTISTYAAVTGTPNNATIEIQYDDGTNNHFPNGTVIRTYNRTSTSGWHSDTITPFSVTKGLFYHIVVYNTSWTASNYQRMYYNTYTDSTNNEKLLLYNGTSWGLENSGNLRQPIYFFRNTTQDEFFGVAVDMYPVITTNMYVGERIILNDTITIYELAFHGESSSPVGDVSYNITYTNGTDIANVSVGSNYSFPSDGYGVGTFSSPVILLAGTYDFLFKTSSMIGGSYRPHRKQYPVDSVSDDTTNSQYNDNGALRPTYDMYYWINRNTTNGNLTTWHDSGAGNEVYQLDVNVTTPTNTNYTTWYRQNNTGNYVQIGGTYTGNNTIALNPKYQNTDARIQLQGNSTATPELISITFYDQAVSGGGGAESIPSTPINLANTTGNFYVNHTWSAGAGNVTNSYNVSQNGTWTNGSANTYYNATVYAHGWSNITVWAYNSTGNGSRSTSSTSQNTQVLNNAISISGVSDSYSLQEGQILSVDANYSDPDSDIGTFDRNFTKGAFNTGTGVLTWTTADGDQGTYQWQINVTDGYGSVALKNFTVTVLDSTPAVISNIQNTTGNYWINWTWTAGSNLDDYDIWINDTDIGADTTNLYYNGTYSAHATRTISIRSHNHTLDAYSAWVNQTTTIPNNAISISGISDTYSINAGNTLSIDANYSDPDSDTGTFDRNFTKGTFNTGTGILSWTTGVGDIGTYQWQINVTDGYGSVASKNFTVSIVSGGGGGTNWDWLDGYVLAANGSAVSGASIVTSAGSTTSAANGYYSYGYVFVDLNTYWINVSKTGFQSNNTQITFTLDHTVFNSSLSPNLTANVSGYVLDSNGSVISSATVSYSGGSNNSDTNGYWLISSIENGTYSFTASKAGYTSNTTSITTNGSALTNQNFTLNTSANCDWYQNVNVTVYANGTAKTCSAGGSVVGNLTVSFVQNATTDTYTYNLTSDNATYRAFNESSNNGTVGMQITHSNVTASTNYTVKIYWNNGTKFQDLYIQSNSSGYLVYNTTGFEYARYTIIQSNTMGTSYVVVAIAATVIIGGAAIILRRIRRV